MEVTNAVTGRKWQYAVTSYEEPIAEPSNTKKEHLTATEDKARVEVVEAEEDAQNADDALDISDVGEEIVAYNTVSEGELEMSEEQAFAEPHEEADNEAADVIHEQEPVATELAEKGTDRINVRIEDKLQARIIQDEEFRTELSDTKEEHLDAAENKISVEAVETAKEIDNIPELDDEAATIQQDQAPLVDFHEAADDQIVVGFIEVVQDLEKTATLVVEDINIENELDAEVEEPFASMLPPSAVDDDPVNQEIMMSCANKQQTQIIRATNKMVDVPVEASERGDPYSGMELPDSFERPDDLSVVPMQVICQRPQDHDDSILQTESRNAYKQDPYVQKLDAGVEPVVYSVRKNGLDETSPRCAAQRDNKESGGSDVLETVSCAMLLKTGGDGYQMRENREPEKETEMNEAAAEALIFCVEEGSVMKRTKACYTEQSMNPRRGRLDGLWMEEGCWIYFIQDATGRLWEKSCRDLQTHHEQPD